MTINQSSRNILSSHRRTLGSPVGGNATDRRYADTVICLYAAFRSMRRFSSGVTLIRITSDLICTLAIAKFLL
jgi:hypothetical protein